MTLELFSVPCNDRDSARVFVYYRFPYEKLLFIKSGNIYSTGISFTCEAKSKETGEIKREYSGDRLSLRSYQETRSSSKFAEGLLRFRLKKGAYQIFPKFILDRVPEDLSMPPVELNIKRDSAYSFLKPLPVEAGGETSGCFRMLNKEIPFSHSPSWLLITSVKKGIKAIRAEFYQADSLVYTERTVCQDLKFQIIKKNGGIFFCPDSAGDNIGLFVVKNHSQKLAEGPLKIKIIPESSPKDSVSFLSEVKWFNKPKTLVNPEYAIGLLKAITQGDQAFDMLRGSSKKYPATLEKFWEKLDPDKTTRFNEAEEEFYKRADYALMNFSTVGSKNGAETERGITYMKYGPPDSVSRDYESKDRIIEIWDYHELKKQFRFSDTSGGLGNFMIEK